MAATSVLAGLVGAMAVTAPPKAIVLMLGDDYGYNNVGFAHGPLGAGNPEMKTPNMDALVSEGIVLERHYVFKYCSPTRSSLMSGRLPPHVNQNNRNNDIEAASGCDLRFKFIAQKMKEAGFATAMIGKSHLGARSPANLPINRGFDVHFGFLKGGEDHYSQGSGSANGEGPGTVDLWDGHAISNRTGVYSGYNYAERAVAVIENFTATNTALVAAGRAAEADSGIFMYLAWHNTHTPLECPPEWSYPAYYNNSDQSRMTYNCMARILDDGIGNVTAALKAGGVWDETLMLFAADNGGWNGNTGSSNWPLKGSKVSDFEGGIRAVSFLAGGYLPANLHGTHHTGYIAVADWYGTLCGLVGVSPTDDVPGLPPVDSVDVWPSILVPNANSTGRTEIFLSWSCTASSAAITGCDPTAPSIYNTTGDPTAGQGPGDMGLISGQYKIVIGDQQGRGIWTGPIYPNGTADPHPTPCAEGCLYDIFADPTEHVNLKDTMPSVYTAMMAKLTALGKTVYQTDYSEPGTEGNCLTGAQARALYAGRDTCIEGSPGYNPSYPRCNSSTVGRGNGGNGRCCDPSTPVHHLGPMCFKTLPPVPPTPPPGPPSPVPPPPVPPSPVFSLAAVGNGGCLVGPDQQFAPLALGGCAGGKRWSTNSAYGQGAWVAWDAKWFAKIDLQGSGLNGTDGCKRGEVYLNDAESRKGRTSQGFVVKALPGSTGGAVQLTSSLCPGLCLGFPKRVTPDAGASPKAIACAAAAPWTMATGAIRR